MKVYFCLVCVTIILLIRVVCSEYYSAIAHLKHILYTEKNIARELKTNIRKEEERLAILKSIADDYENHSSTAFSNLSFYTENPVNAFLLIKKFTVGWNRTYAILKSSADATVVSNMLLHMKHLPSSVDFNGAAVSLLRLQDTYQLQTSEIASGNIAGSRAAELTAEDCFEIGKIAYNSADFYHAVMWLQESLVRWENEKIKMFSKELILDYLSFSTFKKGNVKHALMLSEDLLAINPNHQRVKKNKAYFEKIIHKEMKLSNYSYSKEVPFENKREANTITSLRINVNERICQGISTHKPRNTHKLKCRYISRGNPFLKLAPVKEEEIHLKPWIVMYHDVISDREIKIAKEFATPKLERAQVKNYQKYLLYGDYRTSQVAWLFNGHPLSEKLDSRIKSITQLDLTYAEMLQVANYGIAGHFAAHFDYFQDSVPLQGDDEAPLQNGDRIATFMFYLNDVKAGGSTAFPSIGINIFPKKGSAIFWYNLHKNGKGDKRTLHEACPVLLGTKWVINKWICEYGQEFHRPCSLNKSD